MIRVQQVKVPLKHTREDVVKRFSTPCISIIDDDFIVRENDSLNGPRAVNKLKLIYRGNTYDEHS